MHANIQNTMILEANHCCMVDYFEGELLKFLASTIYSLNLTHYISNTEIFNKKCHIKIIHKIFPLKITCSVQPDLGKSVDQFWHNWNAFYCFIRIIDTYSCTFQTQWQNNKRWLSLLFHIAFPGHQSQYRWGITGEM